MQVTDADYSAGRADVSSSVAVGFVGAGQLGLPMVRRLVAAGHLVTVYARRDEVREELISIGARVAPTARAAAQAADVVIACLFDDDQLLSVCHGDDGILAGLRADAVLVSHVTGRQETIESLAKRTEAAIVDGPVSGTAEDIADGRLTVLAGGTPSAVDRCAVVLAAYASTVLRTGPRGSGLAVKLVNNLLFAAHAQLAAEAVLIAERLGVERALLLHVLAECSGASYAAAIMARFPDSASFSQVTGPFMRKDIAACRAQLATLGTDGGLLAEVVARGLLPLSGDPAV